MFSRVEIERQIDAVDRLLRRVSAAVRAWLLRLRARLAGLLRRAIGYVGDALRFDPAHYGAVAAGLAHGLAELHDALAREIRAGIQQARALARRHVAAQLDVPAPAAAADPGDDEPIPFPVTRAAQRARDEASPLLPYVLAGGTVLAAAQWLAQRGVARVGETTAGPLAAADEIAEELSRRVGVTASGAIYDSVSRAYNDTALDAIRAAGVPKQWATEPGACRHICRPLEGVVVGVDEDFETAVGPLAAPPAHRFCRCHVVAASASRAMGVPGDPGDDGDPPRVRWDDEAFLRTSGRRLAAAADAPPAATFPEGVTSSATLSWARRTYPHLYLDLAGLPDEHVVEIVRGYHAFAGTDWQAARNVRYIGTGTATDAPVRVGGHGSQLATTLERGSAHHVAILLDHPSWRDAAKMRALLEGGAGEHVPASVATVRGTISHELGHVAEFHLQRHVAARAEIDALQAAHGSATPDVAPAGMGRYAGENRHEAWAVGFSVISETPPDQRPHPTWPAYVRAQFDMLQRLRTARPELF